MSWAESDRGVSYIFGKKVVEKFIEKYDFDLIVRAHQVVQKGFEFFARRKLVTVFSAPNYMNEFDNSGGKIDAFHNNHNHLNNHVLVSLAVNELRDQKDQFEEKRKEKKTQLF